MAEQNGSRAFESKKRIETTKIAHRALAMQEPDIAADHAPLALDAISAEHTPLCKARESVSEEGQDARILAKSGPSQLLLARGMELHQRWNEGSEIVPADIAHAAAATPGAVSRHPQLSSLRRGNFAERVVGGAERDFRADLAGAASRGKSVRRQRKQRRVGRHVGKADFGGVANTRYRGLHCVTDSAGILFLDEHVEIIA